MRSTQNQCRQMGGVVHDPIGFEYGPFVIGFYGAGFPLFETAAEPSRLVNNHKSVGGSRWNAHVHRWAIQRAWQTQLEWSDWPRASRYWKLRFEAKVKPTEGKWTWRISGDPYSVRRQLPTQTPAPTFCLIQYVSRISAQETRCMQLLLLQLQYNTAWESIGSVDFSVSSGWVFDFIRRGILTENHTAKTVIVKSWSRWFRHSLHQHRFASTFMSSRWEAKLNTRISCPKVNRKKR